MLTFNTKKDGPLQQVEIRKLIGDLIDRKQLTRLGKPRIDPAQGFYIENRKVEHSSTIFKERPHNKNIYSGERLVLVTYSRHSLDAKLIQRMLAEAGIRLELKIVNWEKVQSKEVLENADMIMFEGTPNEGIISILELLCFEQGFIYPFLSEKLKTEMEQFISRLKGESSSLGRLKIYKELEKFLIGNGVISFLVHKQVEVYHHYSLEGVHVNSRMWIDFQDIWYKHHTIS